jgi:predicted PP-loop superfamily ATPase
MGKKIEIFIRLCFIIQRILRELRDSDSATDEAIPLLNSFPKLF